MGPDADPPLKITDDDLDRAVVGHLPVSRPTTAERSFAPPRPAVDGWNGVAIGAAVVAAFAALLALALVVFNTEEPGVALFGLAAGLGAVVLACVALARPARSRLRGTGLAVGGIGVGIAAVAGCLVIITETARPDANFAAAAFEPDPQALEKLAPQLQRAMKANVLVEGRSGWKGLGGQTIGSGVILRINGGQAYVVTNRHVVDHGFTEGASGSRGIAAAGPFKIKLIGQAAQPASVVWVAPDGIDLAIASVAIMSDEPQFAEWVNDP